MNTDVMIFKDVELCLWGSGTTMDKNPDAVVKINREDSDERFWEDMCLLVEWLRDSIGMTYNIGVRVHFTAPADTNTGALEVFSRLFQKRSDLNEYRFYTDKPFWTWTKPLAAVTWDAIDALPGRYRNSVMV